MRFSPSTGAIRNSKVAPKAKLVMKSELVKFLTKCINEMMVDGKWELFGKKTILIYLPPLPTAMADSGHS